jgi:hypothetical protein
MNLIDFVLKEARVLKWSVLQENQIQNMVDQFAAQNKAKILTKPEDDFKELKKPYYDYAKKFNEHVIKKLSLNIADEKRLLIWILQQMIDKQFNIDEDLEVVKQNLELYYKNRGKINKKIYDFKYEDVKKWVEEYMPKGQEAELQEFLSSPIAQGKGYKIYKITDPKIAVKVSQHTSWCTQGEKTAKEYVSKGPLFLVMKNNHRFALIHFEKSQFMDVNDITLKMDVIKDIFSIWSEFQELLDVRKNGELLKYIDNQTEEICLEAVKKNGWALRYVKKQTPEICLAAVKENGWALQYVKEQTSEICLAAVKKAGTALEHVKEQTPEICSAALKEDNSAFFYVQKPTDKQALDAFKINPSLISNKSLSEKVQLEIVKQNKRNFKYIKEPFKSVIDYIKENSKLYGGKK